MDHPPIDSLAIYLSSNYNTDTSILDADSTRSPKNTGSFKRTQAFRPSDFGRFDAWGLDSFPSLPPLDLDLDIELDVDEGSDIDSPATPSFPPTPVDALDNNLWCLSLPKFTEETKDARLIFGPSELLSIIPEERSCSRAIIPPLPMVVHPMTRTKAMRPVRRPRPHMNQENLP